MHPLEVTHWTLVQTRTRIRHDKRVLLWIQRCWNAVHSGGSLDRAAFDAVNKTLLKAMTIDWDEDVFRVITDLMWRRDATTFAVLDTARFSCSLFAFAEMWVEALDASDYVRVFQVIHRILSSASRESIIHCSNPTTLTAFLDALRHDLQLAAMNISIGKSTVFDAATHAQTFETMLPDAVSTLVHHQSPQRRKSLSGLHSPPPPFRPRSCSPLVRTDTKTSPPNPSTASLVTRGLVIARPHTKRSRASWTIK